MECFQTKFATSKLSVFFGGIATGFGLGAGIAFTAGSFVLGVSLSVIGILAVVVGATVMYYKVWWRNCRRSDPPPNQPSVSYVLDTVRWGSDIGIEEGCRDNLPLYTGIFINNEFVSAKSGKTFETVNPANGRVLANVAKGDKSDVDIAVKAARKAFQVGSEWRQMEGFERGRLLLRLASLMKRKRTILASLVSVESGMPYAISYTADAGMAAEIYSYYAGWADKDHGKTIPIEGDYFTYTRHEPVGVCGQIIPWNFPLVMQAWKLGPALAMGNTVVMKVAEQTPLSALYVAALTKEAGFPDGVVNVIPGYGHTAGQAISSHMDVDMVAFTGSTEVGRLVMKAAAESNAKKVVLELGGKSPNIIFADANLDEAVAQANHGLFFNQGELYTAGSRSFVEGKVYDEFVARSKALAEKAVIGDPFDLKATHWPQVDENQVKDILEYIKEAKEGDAELVCGGIKHGVEGHFVKPTIVGNVKINMTIAQEEIFGPVMSIIRFDSMEELVEKANNTICGLPVCVMTKDIDKALHIANTTRAGSVMVSCFYVFDAAAQFGGFKQTGLGYQLGQRSLEKYTVMKTVTKKATQKKS
ncbi:unnamed protein product [Caenorhabditis nigoni]